MSDFPRVYPPDGTLASYTLPPGTTPDATTISMGKLKLAGDLGGTANSPTVPQLPKCGRATVNFGGAFTDHASVVVTGLAWVTAGSNVSPSLLVEQDPDELRLLDVRALVSDLVAGIGFTLHLFSEPEARGTYTLMWVGR